MTQSPTCRLLRALLKPDEIGSLEDHGVRPQLRGRQAGGDGRAQEVHRGVAGQAQELLLCRMGPWGTGGPPAGGGGRGGGGGGGAGGALLSMRRLRPTPEARLFPDSLRSGRTQERKVKKKNPLTERSESSLFGN